MEILFNLRLYIPGNPQEIFAHNWYIFKSMNKSFFKIQNTIDYPKILKIVSLIII